MHILLTRPLEDSHELILRFQKLGHHISHLPLIKIEKKNHEKLNFSDYRGIVFTNYTIEELYLSRHVLYKKYADITIDCRNRSADFLADSIYAHFLQIPKVFR